MNYQSGDRLKNRYLSNDAFTSLKNKLGGRSIISLGNRRRNSYKIANQGFDLLEYKNLIYKSFVTIILLMILLYVIPQTRYFMHGFAAKSMSDYENINTNSVEQENIYNIAPRFLKTDAFIAKQKDVSYIDTGVYVYNYFTNQIVGVTENNSSSTINIKLFSEQGFKNNFLIEQDVKQDSVPVTVSSSTASTTETESAPIVVTESDKTYQSYVFEGMGYGQLIAKVPPETKVKKDSYVYIRTVDGLKPIAVIMNVDEDNKSTFTIISAQLINSPQNLYKVFFK